MVFRLKEKWDGSGWRNKPKEFCRQKGILVRRSMEMVGGRYEGNVPRDVEQRIRRGCAGVSSSCLFINLPDLVNKLTQFRRGGSSSKFQGKKKGLRAGRRKTGRGRKACSPHARGQFFH